MEVGKRDCRCSTAFLRHIRSQRDCCDHELRQKHQDSLSFSFLTDDASGHYSPPLPTAAVRGRSKTCFQPKEASILRNQVLLFEDDANITRALVIAEVPPLLRIMESTSSRKVFRRNAICM
eukprot:TRINITY_DN30900_c0_g1_i1.p1 TRINITY_DN30900_c0_g1~~TRINITY_DN30900_c0_g1_i1.p1  ORF type:complete len:121 (-),score=20.86 TRINITY_DN30900_c0_g1_i1:202-564(-)